MLAGYDDRAVLAVSYEETATTIGVVGGVSPVLQSASVTSAATTDGSRE